MSRRPLQRLGILTIGYRPAQTQTSRVSRPKPRGSRRVIASRGEQHLTFIIGTIHPPLVPDAVRLARLTRNRGGRRQTGAELPEAESKWRSGGRTALGSV